MIATLAIMQLNFQAFIVRCKVSQAPPRVDLVKIFDYGAYFYEVEPGNLILDVKGFFFL
jgi:hypothetical protein